MEDLVRSNPKRNGSRSRCVRPRRHKQIPYYFWSDQRCAEHMHRPFDSLSISTLPASTLKKIFFCDISDDIGTEPCCSAVQPPSILLLPRQADYLRDPAQPESESSKEALEGMFHRQPSRNYSTIARSGGFQVCNTLRKLLFVLIQTSTGTHSRRESTNSSTSLRQIQ